MTEEQVRTSASQRPTDGAASAGALLRQAREAARMHVAALAGSLKVPPARIEALEAGRLDLLPDPVFARALAASICRSLKIDPEPVLQLLPRNAATAALGQQDTSAASTRVRPRPERPARPGIFSRPLAWAALALVIGALVLVFLPELGWRDRLGANQAGDSAAVAPAPAAAAKPGPAAQGNQGASASAAPTAPAAPLKPLPQASAQSPTTPAADQSAGAVTPAPAPTKPPATDTVVFHTQTAAWVSVIDANGKALLRKNVPAGQTVGVSGDLPMRVTVGRADVTKVSVRGEPMDLAPVTKGGVARFEVK